MRACPQKKAVVRSLVIIKPKKPNSAKRKIAKVFVPSIKKRTRCGIPGSHKNKDRDLKKYSKVMIRGGRSRDIIGIRYKVILGLLDAKPFFERKTARSKYGVKKI